jgi:hypothetical protein
MEPWPIHVGPVGHASPGDHHGIVAKARCRGAPGLCCMESDQGPGTDRDQQSAGPIFKQAAKGLGSELPQVAALQIDLNEHKGAHLAGLKGLTPEYRVEAGAVATHPDSVWVGNQSRSHDHFAGSMVQGQQDALDRGDSSLR